MRNRKTLQLTMDAMLAAMCAVLGWAARFTDFGFIKISFESLPVLVAALLFGLLLVIIGVRRLRLNR